MRPSCSLAFDSDFTRPQTISFPVENLFFEPLPFELRNIFSVEDSIEKGIDANVSAPYDMPLFSPLSRSNSPIIHLQGGSNHLEGQCNLSNEDIAARTNLPDEKPLQTPSNSRKHGDVQNDAFMNPFMLFRSRDVEHAAQNEDVFHTNNSEMLALDVSPRDDARLQKNDDLFGSFDGSDVRLKYLRGPARDDANRNTLQTRVCEAVKDATQAEFSPQNLLTGVHITGEERIEQAGNALGIVCPSEITPPGHSSDSLIAWEHVGLDELLQPSSPTISFTLKAPSSGECLDTPITDHEISHGLPPQNPAVLDSRATGNQSTGKRSTAIIDELTKDMQGSARHKRQKMEQESGPEDDAPIAQWRHLRRDSMKNNLTSNKEELTRAEQLKLRRAMRNRESARRSRIKSKVQFQTLEQRYAQLSVENIALNNLVEMIIPSSLRVISREAKEAFMIHHY